VIQIPKYANFEYKSLQKDIQDIVLMDPKTMKGHPTSLWKLESIKYLITRKIKTYTRYNINK